MSTCFDPTLNSRAAAPSPQTGDASHEKQEFERFLEHAQQRERSDQGARSLRAWLELAEAWRITQALRDCRGNRSAAARTLGIGRRTLYSKMEKLNISATWGI